SFGAVYAQDNVDEKSSKAPVDDFDLMGMSLEDLLNVKVVSASREEEDIFKSPLTSYVVTREEIEKAGITSIPEALRLVPGMFVVEQSNGNYEVDIRGLNNVPPLNYTIVNTSVLVMIDNRPIFSPLQGGTIWEALPIDIHDVERIEVIAGPSSALFGPNAKNGVINIITRKHIGDSKTRVYTNTHSSVTNLNTVANLGISHKLNDKFSFGVSGNMSVKQRQQIEYYSNAKGKYFNNIDSVLTPSALNDKIKQRGFANEQQSLNRFGLNVFADYVFNEKANINLTAGRQQSEGLKFQSIAGTRLVNWVTHSNYAKASANFYGFSTLLSYNSGDVNFFKGIDAFKYDFKTVDFYLDYTLRIKNLLSLKPSISFQEATASDEKYYDKLNPTSATSGIFRGSGLMSNLAGGLRADFTPSKKFRFIAAVRGDRFTYPRDKYFVSYQFIGNYSPNKNHHFRVVHSKSYNSSFIIDNFINFPFQSISPPPTNQTIYAIDFKYNKDLKPGSLTLTELGYRLKVSNKASFDVVAFYQVGQNYSTFVYTKLDSTFIGPPFGYNQTQSLMPSNLSMKVVQTGVTFSGNIFLKSNKINLKPFITMQQTEWRDFSPYYYQPGGEYIPPPIPGFTVTAKKGYNLDRTSNVKANVTPSAFGGLYSDFMLFKKLSLNISLYYFDAFWIYSTDHIANPNVDGDLLLKERNNLVKGKLLANAKLTYKINDDLKVFINARNLTNNDSREYYATDRIGAMYLFGLHLDLK
ncbi:MAG: TonB-dependent receptor plug domain-containing protein, partial [Cytophagales bacterium]